MKMSREEVQKRKISDKVFVELHVDVPSEELLNVLKVMESIGYDIVAIVNKTISEVSQLQHHLDRLLLLSKLYVTSRELGKILRVFRRFDLISVQPENRFVLNKIIRLPEVDLVTIDLTNLDAVPSKDQLKIMAEEGKALEILLDKVLTGSYKLLKALDILVHQVYKIDNLVLFFSQNVKSVYDVRNPRDVIALIQVITEIDNNYFKMLRESWLRYIVDTFYRRGVENITYYPGR